MGLDLGFTSSLFGKGFDLFSLWHPFRGARSGLALPTVFR